jgi:hypothetical protein
MPHTLLGELYLSCQSIILYETCSRKGLLLAFPYPGFSAIMISMYQGNAHPHPEMVFRKAQESDFGEILRVQKENLVTNLGEEEKGEGFLSIQFDPPQLREILGTLGIFVASKEQRFAGYLMAQTLEFGMQFPVIKKMASRFQGLQFLGRPLRQHRIFIYGPVCVERGYRGSGILEGLFHVMGDALRGQFSAGVAFISKSNPRSYEAHVRKLGMQAISEFEFDGKNFWILAFSVDPRPS